jgi:hypothetical protein
MANVKKAYQPIMELLEANPDTKVKTILEQVRALCSAKVGRGGGGSAFIKDADGNTVAIMDYYFKRWMPLVGPKAVDFGAKKNTATGYNSMCKEGVSHWTKQQRVAKQAGSVLLTRVAQGEVKPAQIAEEQAKIEAERNAVVATDMGFETREDLVKYLTKNGVKLAAE